MAPLPGTEPPTSEDATPEVITFEDGYEELKAIVARLSADDVSIDELLGGFRRGRGLAEALRTYLTEREGELTEIEQGDNLPQFNVVAPSAGPAQES
jgi:exodeoxyribonuclease VII small subunit